MGCGCSCGKGTPVSDPTDVAGSSLSMNALAPEEFVGSPIAGIDEVDEAELERKEKEALDAQRERDHKARERRVEQERRASLAKKLAEQNNRQELALAEHLERQMDGSHASSEESETSSEEEEDMPAFLMGKRIKLRDPARGTMRRTKINLNSGYDVSKVAKLVERDLAWQEPEGSEDEAEGKPPLIFSVRLDMDFDYIDDENRVQFEDEVLGDIAEACAVPRELLHVSALRSGSIIVDMALERDLAALGDGITADGVVLQLIAQIKDIDSKVYQGKHTSRIMSITPAEKLEDPAKAKNKPEPQKIPLWRTVVLYVCSSLEEDRGRGDVEDERKVLYRDVLPQLRTKYAQRMIHLLTVDPRLSYSKEPVCPEEAADVIKTAAWGVEEGEPSVVLALRGAKHGWVPDSRQQVPESFQMYWRKLASLQQLEMDVAMSKAACAIVYYRSAPGRQESDEEDIHSSSDEVEVLDGHSLPLRPNTVAAMENLERTQSATSKLTAMRPHTMAGHVRGTDGEATGTFGGGIQHTITTAGSDPAGAAASAERPTMAIAGATPSARTSSGLDVVTELVGDEVEAETTGDPKDTLNAALDGGASSEVIGGTHFGGTPRVSRTSFMLVGRNFGSAEGQQEQEAEEHESAHQAGRVLQGEATLDTQNHGDLEQAVSAGRGSAVSKSGVSKSGVSKSGEDSRPSTPGSQPSVVLNSRTSSAGGSSVGSVQAREELCNIGDHAQHLVSDAFTDAVCDLQDSLSTSARSGASLSRPGSSSRPPSVSHPLRLHSAIRPVSSGGRRGVLQNTGHNTRAQDSARSGMSAPGTTSSVGTVQARDELLLLQHDTGDLVDCVLDRAVDPQSGSSTPACTERSAGSSVGSLGTLQGRQELAQLGGDAEYMVGDVLNALVGACSNRSVGSSVATQDAREDLLNIDGNVGSMLDHVVSVVVGSFPSARSGASGASRPNSAFQRGVATPSSVSTEQGRVELLQLGGQVGNLLDDVVGGVFDTFPPSSRAPGTHRSLEGLSSEGLSVEGVVDGLSSEGVSILEGVSTLKGVSTLQGLSTTPGMPQADSIVNYGVQAHLQTDSRSASPVDLQGSGKVHETPPAASSARSDLETWQHTAVGHVLQESAQDDTLQEQQVGADEQADSTKSGSPATVFNTPTTQRISWAADDVNDEDGVLQETPDAMFKRERRRLRRSDQVYVRHYEATYVAAQARTNTDEAEQEGEVDEWNEISAAAAAATAAAAVGKRELTGQVSWKKVKQAVEVATAFVSTRDAPPDRVSPESLAHFAAAVRKDLEKVLDQICTEWGQQEPMQDIIHKERASAARHISAQSPQGTRVRPGMGAEKMRRMMDREARKHSSSVTHPTFNEMVSWQCHQKLWRQRSQALVGSGGRSAKQLLSKVRQGVQTIVLLGERGSGKSALVSRLVRRFSDVANAGWMVLAHHAGAGNAEYSIKSALRRFCGEICQHLKIHAPVPEDANLVDSHLRELLVKATSLYGANILLVIDGYDQMENVDLTNVHAWIPQGEVLGLQIVLTLEENTTCHTRVLSRVDDCAEIRLSALEEKETLQLAERQLSQLLPGFELDDLPIRDLVNASQLGLRPPLWMVTACRVIKGMVELYGFTQFSPEESYAQHTLPSSASRAISRTPSFSSSSWRLGSRGGGRTPSSLGRGSERVSKVLLPGSALHSTICDLIRSQWSQAWADLPVLLDSLIVAMEQVFSSDLVRDMMSLMVSSPAGLDQLDLLTLLGYGYPVDVGDDDAFVSTNPSPQLSPRESPPRADSSATLTPVGHDILEQSADYADATAGSSSAMLIQVSASHFGCVYAAEELDAHAPPAWEAPHIAENVAAAHHRRRHYQSARLRENSGLPISSSVACTAGALASSQKSIWHAHTATALLYAREGDGNTSAHVSDVSVLISGGAFGTDSNGHGHGHGHHEEAEEHTDMCDHSQDTAVFTRLLR